MSIAEHQLRSDVAAFLSTVETAAKRFGHEAERAAKGAGVAPPVIKTAVLHVRGRVDAVRSLLFASTRCAATTPPDALVHELDSHAADLVEEMAQFAKQARNLVGNKMSARLDKVYASATMKMSAARSSMRCAAANASAERQRRIDAISARQQMDVSSETTEDTSEDDDDDEVSRLRQRVSELEAAVRERDAQIARLEDANKIQQQERATAIAAASLEIAQLRLRSEERCSMVAEHVEARLASERAVEDAAMREMIAAHDAAIRVANTEAEQLRSQMKTTEARLAMACDDFDARLAHERANCAAAIEDATARMKKQMAEQSLATIEDMDARSSAHDAALNAVVEDLMTVNEDLRRRLQAAQEQLSMTVDDMRALLCMQSVHQVSTAKTSAPVECETPVSEAAIDDIEKVLTTDAEVEDPWAVPDDLVTREAMKALASCSEDATFQQQAKSWVTETACLTAWPATGATRAFTFPNVDATIKDAIALYIIPMLRRNTLLKPRVDVLGVPPAKTHGHQRSTKWHVTVVVAPRASVASRAPSTSSVRD